MSEQIPTLDMLRFTARAISEIEKRTNKPFVKTVEDIAKDGLYWTPLLLLVSAGLNTTEKQAEEAVDNYLAEGKNIVDLISRVFLALAESGFLPKAQMKEAVRQMEMELNQTTGTVNDSLQISG